MISKLIPIFAALLVFSCGDGDLVTYSYSANGGSGAPAAQTKTRNVLLRLSSTVPAREGYTFAGWNTEAGGGGTSYASGSIYTSNVSVTFYAQWKLIVLNCDGLTFKTIAIGEQVWMAENLNCNLSGSLCYNNQESNCDIYGRLYNWATAMALPSSCNYDFCKNQINTPHQGICPSGWHIPTHKEWDELYRYADGKHLKARSGWNDYNEASGNGEDAFGFAALPGGFGISEIKRKDLWDIVMEKHLGLPDGYDHSDVDFYNAGYYGHWWSAAEDGTAEWLAFSRGMDYDKDRAHWSNSYKIGLFSVRCARDLPD